ncbi:MAG: PAS domain-containing protein [Gemmatimonas sp.]
MLSPVFDNQSRGMRPPTPRPEPLSFRTFRWPSFAIIVGAFTIALLCDGFVYHVLAAAHSEAVQTTEAENTDFARVMGEYVAKTMQGVDLLVETTKHMIESDSELMTPGSPELIARLQQQVAIFPGVSRLVVLDARGNWIGSNRRNPTRGSPNENYADRAFFSVQRDNPDLGLYIDAPRRGMVSGDALIAVSRALKTRDGEFDGVVLGMLQLESLKEFFRAGVSGNSGAVALWRNDGTALLRVPDPNNIAGNRYPNLFLLSQMTDSPTGSFESPGTTDGKSRHVSYRMLPGVPLTVTVARAYDDVLSPWRRSAWTYGSIAAVLNVLIVGLGGILAREMSRRERSEAVAREGERLIRLVADNVPMLIAYVDRNLRYRFVNRVTERWMGQPATEFIGRTVAEMLPPLFYERSKPRIAAALRGEAQTFEEFRTYGDGVERWASVTYVPVAEGAGGYLVVVADITGRKRAEARLREHEEQLRQAQKMEVVGQLTGGVAHDFNNLLGVILGNLDLLDTMLRERPEAQRVLRRAIDAVERGGSLTRQLLAFSRKQMLQPRAITVGELLSELAQLLRRTLGESVDVVTAAAADLWPCRADQSQLETAILNLALNARDAMPKGGRLSILAENFAIGADDSDQFDDVTPGDYVMVAISDTGTGMPPDVAARAFEPFFTTKEVGKGSGLGLSMVYGFVKQSGGHVRLYSEPGMGTTVKLFLPRARSEELAGPARSRDIDTPALGGGELILVVEDNLALRQIAVTTLEKLGYRTVEASTADEALGALAEHPDVDLMFTDVVLPGGRNGFDLAAEAHRRMPRLRILFASGHPNVGDAAHGAPPGALVMAKPFRAAELARSVRQALESEAA